MTSYPSKQPVEILTAELRGCCNGYIGAPALAAQLVSALRVAGYIIVPKGAIGRAQDDAVREYVAGNDNVQLSVHKAA